MHKDQHSKQSVSSIEVDLWQDLPNSLKKLNTLTFSGKAKALIFLKLNSESKMLSRFLALLRLIIIIVVVLKCVYLLLLLLFFLFVVTTVKLYNNFSLARD